MPITTSNVYKINQKCTSLRRFTKNFKYKFRKKIKSIYDGLCIYNTIQYIFTYSYLFLIFLGGSVFE